MLSARDEELASLRAAVRSRLDLGDLATDPVPSTSGAQRAESSEHYFSSYADNAIHEEMLRDRVRTESYRDFIERNADRLFRGKTVLDVGCGTGILSMFAARAGARKVYAVDASAIALKATRNVRDNALDGVVEVYRSRVEDLALPEKVDVVISEWMGYFLLYEAMLPAVLYARDHFLKPGGIVAPTQCSILIAAIDSSNLLDSRASFWSDVYGFDMSAMADGIFDDALTDIVPASELMSAAVPVKDIDVQHMTVSDIDFSSEFELVIDRTGVVKALCGWFDTFFTVDGSPTPALALDRGGESLPATTLGFSTGPRATPTHWKQAILRFASPLQVQQGGKLVGTMRCTKSVENERELEVTVQLHVHAPDGSVAADLVAQVWRVR